MCFIINCPIICHNQHLWAQNSNMAAIGIGWLYHINNMSKTARHHFIHTLMDNRDLDEAIICH